METGPMTTIRVSRRTRNTLEALAEKSGCSVQAGLEKAVEFYWGRRLLEATNEAYAVLRANTAAWLELQEERAQWEVTLNDGLKGEKQSKALL